MGKTSSVVKDRYNKKAYDEMKIRVKKGQKATIEAYAKAHGKSLNGFVSEAIDKAMTSDPPAAVSLSPSPESEKAP